MKVVGLALQSVVLAAEATRELRNVQREQERAIGKEAAHCGEVEVEHPLEPEPPRDTLVGDRRVDVAIADDRRTSLERRPDHLVHVLGARRRVQERFRPRSDVTTVQHQVADPLPELRPARLACGDDVFAVGLEPLDEKLGLRRLPRPVEPFQRDEHRPHPTAA